MSILKLLVPEPEFHLNQQQDDGTDWFRARFAKEGVVAKNGWYFPPSAFTKYNNGPIWFTDSHDARNRVGVANIEVNSQSAYGTGPWLSSPEAQRVRNDLREFEEAGGKAQVSIAFSVPDAQNDVVSYWNNGLTRAEIDKGVTMKFLNVQAAHLAIVDAGNLPGATLLKNSEFEEELKELHSNSSLRDEARTIYARQLLR